ncbi:putative amidohydrolase [Microbacterium sp. SORGH_AS 1204]|uniref:carbon-nitrogen hydrolase family protein n=1 Tax=Microbacterium sp. SORGH_AS_1204 TaxID=3041785 RepID=UPI00278F78FA|nr:carbon-nitrogen hydrolase family protein [Microbacterium sp. SORGH_AS_1204]MDQ1136545.1 putative amidohydrolase [Microbacterium sp. SORGH_AS_1204]
MTVRIATVQAEAVPGAIGRNVAQAARYVGDSATAGANVILFPEAFLTGYDDTVFAGVLPRLDDLGWLSPLQDAVDETRVIAVVNTALQRGAHRTLTDLVIAPGRPPLPAYAKQHLYASERELFTPGAGGYSFRLGDVDLALSVCYDANFPEHAATAATAGATVYLNSGAYFPGGERRRDLHLAARALDNSMYVVYSGLVGAPSGFIGGSAVFDPLGHRVTAVDGREGLAVVDIDSAVVDEVRRDQRMWTDRRADLGLFERSGELDPHGPRPAPL